MGKMSESCNNNPHQEWCVGKMYGAKMSKMIHCAHEVKEYAQAEGVSAGFGVDLELASDLSRGIGMSETAECWENVQRTSTRPHIDLVPGGNGTGMRLMCADT